MEDVNAEPINLIEAPPKKKRENEISLYMEEDEKEIPVQMDQRQ